MLSGLFLIINFSNIGDSKIFNNISLVIFSYKSKLEFDTDLLISEINQNFQTGSVSNDNLKMENYEGTKTQFDKMKYFNEVVLPIFEGCKFDNIFLFFAQPEGGLDRKSVV